MELKNLFSKFTPSEEKKESFLALEVAEQIVTVAVWQVEEKIKIIAIGSKQHWDGKTPESLISASDNAMASALENLPEEPNKIVFGLPQAWVNDNKIVPSRLTELKNLCQKLDLKPLGFVVTTEAIIQYLKSFEGTPASIILIQVAQEAISLSLVRLGKNLGTQVVGRSEDFGADVYEGLVRFGQKEPLPSRMLLYGTNSENERQVLLAYEWPESLFLHFPKIEMLEAEMTIRAIAMSGGEEAAQALGLKKEIPAEKTGFLKNRDVMEMEKEKGVKNKERKKLSLPAFKLPPIVLPKIKLKMPSFKLPKLNRKPSFLLILSVGLGFLFILSASALAFYWYAPKAKVTLFLKPKTAEKEITIFIDPELTKINTEQKQIPGEVIEVIVKKKQELETTGEKLVGDKAKGEVTVFNFTTESKNFTKGTAIIAPDNREFGLDVDIIISSASSDFDENWNQVIAPGKTKVAITALEIGPEYNLASGSEFKIKSQPAISFRAKNEKAFSGGTSRKVRVVAAKDQENLLSSLKEELIKQLKEELEKKTPAGKTILKEGIMTSVVNREFNQAVGTEIDTLQLDLEMKARTLAYLNADLESLLEGVINQLIPPDFVLKRKVIEPREAKIDSEGKASVQVLLKADLIPALNLEEVKKNLTGKYPAVAQEYLSSLTGFVKAEIEIIPSLPARIRTLPRLQKKIDIRIEIKE